MFSFFFVPRTKHTPNFSGEIIEIIEIATSRKQTTNSLRYPQKLTMQKSKKRASPTVP